MVALRGNSSLATLLLLAGFKLWRADWLSGIFTPGTLMSRLATVRYLLWCHYSRFPHERSLGQVRLDKKICIFEEERVPKDFDQV